MTVLSGILAVMRFIALFLLLVLAIVAILIVTAAVIKLGIQGVKETTLHDNSDPDEATNDGDQGDKQSQNT